MRAKARQFSAARKLYTRLAMTPEAKGLSPAIHNIEARGPLRHRSIARSRKQTIGQAKGRQRIAGQSSFHDSGGYCSKSRGQRFSKRKFHPLRQQIRCRKVSATASCVSPTPTHQSRNLGPGCCRCDTPRTPFSQAKWLPCRAGPDRIMYNVDLCVLRHPIPKPEIRGQKR
jgi:hypothetical protein